MRKLSKQGGVRDGGNLLESGAKCKRKLGKSQVCLVVHLRKGAQNVRTCGKVELFSNNSMQIPLFFEWQGLQKLVVKETYICA